MIPKVSGVVVVSFLDLAEMHFFDGRIIVNTYSVLRPEIFLQLGSANIISISVTFQSFNLSVSTESSS